MIKNIILGLCLLSVALGAIPGDLVTSLPGWPKNLNFTMYSGFLDIGSAQKQIHYVFLTKAGAPVNNSAPILLWLNGGPGCSSLEGMLVENGPFVIEDRQTDFNGTFNIWSWNQLVNILYFESPAGVGFSPSNLTINKTNYNDNTTTIDNYNALVSFFKGFPEYANNDFWISGESYAGIYVPHLAAMIDTKNNNGGTKINLKGIMVGNGLIGFSNTPRFAVDYYYGHHLISTTLYNSFQKNCLNNSSSITCKAILTSIDAMLYGINPYNIYGYCYPPYTMTEQGDQEGAAQSGYKFAKWFTYDPQTGESILADGSGVPCVYTTGLTGYLNRNDVKQALHVNTKTNWEICNDYINGNYSVAPDGSLPQYQQLLSSGKYRILIYNGDADSVVPYNDNEYWIENFKLPVVDDWRPWYVSDQVAGFVKYYKGLAFVTVKGAGHMTPQVKRPEAYLMIQYFLNNQPLPSKPSLRDEEFISI
jgi:Carboxypeptidase C (cathepsin A)